MEYKREGGRENDNDYHLVLKDAEGNTMVAEIPDPICIAAEYSTFANLIEMAREEISARYHPTTHFKPANDEIRIWGVGFFDFCHRQEGQSAEGIVEA